MATYVIGDIHGCFDQLQALLDQVKFDTANDLLWFTGDLINGGPKPTEVLRFVKSLGNKHICVLGNHDLMLLAVAAGKMPAPKDRNVGVEPVLEAPDCSELIGWLKTLPMIHYDKSLNILLVHAGVLPQWTLTQIESYANEIETTLRDPNVADYYPKMYGNHPNVWQDNLTGLVRIRLLINIFTRMRFCTADGKLDLENKGDADEARAGFYPWFKLPSVRDPQLKIIFGHWAALMGKTEMPNIIGLDTGCVWGNRLTALRLDDWQYFSVARNSTTL